METDTALMQPTQVNNITSSCEICSGPHDTQYCIENPKQAFVEYASSRTDKVGGKWRQPQNSQNNFSNPPYRFQPNGSIPNRSFNNNPQNFNNQSNHERLVSNFMASQDARLSKFEADFKQQQSEMTNKINIVLKAITDRMVGALPSDEVYGNSNVAEGDLRKFSDIGAWDDMVRVQVPRCMACLDYDEHVDSLSTMDNEIGVTSPESTTQTLPSFEEYTPLVTYPEEIENTLGTPIEVEPLKETKLEEVGLNFNHNTPLSYREVPSFDGPKPQPLLTSPSLDVSLGDVIGPEPPIKPHSPDSFRIKVVDYLTTQTPPSPHVANSLRALEEIHLTWAHLEKKRTRLRTYTNIAQEFSSEAGDSVTDYT
ncbi:hypothetical protein Tco_1506566 [Tanacetum coccineum]